MKYLIQAMAMIADFAVIGVCASFLHFDPWNPLVWILVICTFCRWSSNGGSAAWDPEENKKFMESAKIYGL